MESKGVVRRLAAVLAVDVVGFSRLMGRDEVGTLERFASCRRDVIEPAIVSHGGRIVKLLGDGVLAEFSSVIGAANAAVAIQRQQLKHRGPGSVEDSSIQLRIGITVGDIILEDNDIVGDGVNVAFRVQALADPDGICVTQEVRNAVRDKLPVAFQSIGEVEMKNIARPPRCYRIIFDETAPKPSTNVPELKQERRALRSWHPAVGFLAIAIAIGAVVLWQPWQKFGLQNNEVDIAAEPAIAVVPFQNLSGDPNATYLGQGIAEDIITVLATFPQIRVLSRSSSFASDQYESVRAIAARLGARYILEGSVRMLGDEVRVTAQLVDGTTGENLWAESFDETGSNILALQEEIANRVYDEIAGTEGTLRTDLQRRSWSKSPLELAEYDYLNRGLALWHNKDRADDVEARRIWQDGLGQFPDSAVLRLMLGFTYNRDIYRADTGSNWEDDLAQMERLSAEAQAVPQKPKLAVWLGHTLDAYIAYWREDWPRVVSEAEAAVRLVPNDAFTRVALADLMANAGHTQDAVAWAETGVRRDPGLPPHIKEVLGWALYLDGHPSEALTALNGIGTNWSYLARAAIFARLGQTEAAREALKTYLQEHPGSTIATVAYDMPMHESVRQPFLDDLREAGMSE